MQVNPTSSNDKQAGSENEGRKGSFLASAMNKSGMNKDQVLISNQEIKRPVIDFVDMDTEKVQFAFECAENAIRLLQAGKGDLKYYKDIAEKLKNQFDEKWQGCWHVVVGKSFGAFVSYESKNMILFWIHDWGFLIYKYG